MLWFFLAIWAAFFNGIAVLFTRKIMKRHSVIAYSFAYCLLGSLFVLPVVLIEDIMLPVEMMGWLLLGVATLVWFLFNLAILTGFKYTDVTLAAPLRNLKVLFVLVLSLLLLGEALTSSKVTGTLVIFAGVTVLTWKGGGRGAFQGLSERGVQLMILGAFLSACAAIVDKAAVAYFSPMAYSFLAFLAPAALYGIFVSLRRRQETLELLTKAKYLVLGATLFGALGYLFIIYAFKLPGAEASLIVPVVRCSTFVAVLFGWLFLKEHEDMLKRTIGAIIMIIGVILISGIWFV
jgi:transporter family protein